MRRRAQGSAIEINGSVASTRTVPAPRTDKRQEIPALRRARSTTVMPMTAGQTVPWVGQPGQGRVVTMRLGSESRAVFSLFVVRAAVRPGSRTYDWCWSRCRPVRDRRSVKPSSRSARSTNVPIAAHDIERSEKAMRTENSAFRPDRASKILASALVLGGLFLSGGGCRVGTRAPTPTSESAVRLGLPLVRQDVLDDCGLTSISALCQYWRIEIPVNSDRCR